MTLPSSGQITTDQIMTELGRGGQQWTATDAGVLSLAGKSSGQQLVIPNDFWGKSSYTAPSLSVSPTTQTLSSSAATGTTAYLSATATATVSGGVAPYTYSWTKTSGAAMTIGSPSSATTNFTGSYRSPTTSEADFQCVVTDGRGNTATATTSVLIQVGTVFAP